MQEVDATVVVCTFNRCRSLAETIEALVQQRVDAALRWEVIVVDNNSTDETRRVVEEFRISGTLPELRYEFEGKQGLSHARNQGVRAARGRIVLFTDDDVCPEPDWLQRVVDNMERYDCAACGGWIGPIWSQAPPPWLTERFYGFLAIRPDQRGPYAIELNGDLPFGANVAFRRTVFDEVGIFNVALGRIGSVLAGGEEWDLFRRILGAGGKVMYFPDTRVHHKIEAYRLRKNYFRRWRYQASRNLGEMKDVPGTRQFMGIPLYLFAQLLHAVARAVKARLAAPRDDAFRQEMIVWHFLGLMVGLRDRRRGTNNASPLAHKR